MGESAVGETGGGHEIKLEPETIQKLADILTEEVCAPLEEAAELCEGAQTEFWNWGNSFTAMDYAHVEVRAVTVQNVKSFGDKAVREDMGEKLHITGKNWKEAEEKSKIKKG
jgi:hypothetical protein